MTGTVVVVQARMGSTRLPGKVAMPIGGLPALVLELRRLAPIGLPVVVATSTEQRDDGIAERAAAGGAELVRGDETDVLDRFVAVVDRYRPRTLVRMTGDCPLADPAIVAAVLDLHERSGAAYTTNVLPRSFPKGLDVEVAAADALRAAADEATDRAEREHVTPFLYRRPERFALANLLGPADLGEERWTLDTAEDLDRIRTIADAVADPVSAPFDELLAAAGGVAPPAAGELHLRPTRPTDGDVPQQSVPGECPWRRSWVAEVDGEAVGFVVVDVGHGVVARRVEVSPEHGRAADAAIDALLVGDEQVRL